MASSPVSAPHAAERHTFICAWCNVLLRSSPDPRCETVNYGICPECLEAQLRALTPVNGVRRGKPRKRSIRANGNSGSHSRAILRGLAAG